MSNWTHPVCGPCYDELQPGRQPYQLVERVLETCCRCGYPTRAGIYYRADPAEMEHCEGHEHD